MTTDAPTTTSNSGISTTDGFTDLECYLSLMTRPVAIDSPACERRAHDAAKRITEALFDHEIEVLGLPEHVPGSRRGNRLWFEMDRASSHASASVRMVARIVGRHLVAHEESLLAEVASDEPTDTRFGPERDADIRQVIDLVSRSRRRVYDDGPTPA